MDKLEKVISHLQILRTWCAVNPDFGIGLDIDDCTKAVEWLDAAIALLKAQEPRVLTLEEMQKIASIRDGAIWLEAGAGLMPAFMEFAARDITFFVAIPLTSYRQFFENDWYGKTWRCWSSRPTDEQREATPWLSGE